MSRDAVREARRQQLIEIAEKLFSTKGYANTAVSDIVRAAGVAQGTFYYHFPAKEDIVVEVVKRAVGTLAQELDQILGQTDLSPTARLEAVIRLIAEAAETKWDLLQFIHSDANLVIHERLQGTVSSLLQRRLTPLVEEGIRSGEFTVSHADETVEFFVGGLVYFFHDDASRGNPQRWRQVRAMLEEVLPRMLGVTPEE